MPFLTTDREDPIGYLSKLHNFLREKEEISRRGDEVLRANKLTHVSYPTGERFSPLELIRKGILQYLRDDTQLNNEMGTSGLREGAMAALMLPTMAIPASLGMSTLARGLTGAGLNLAASYPFYKVDPQSAEPLMDSAMGAGAGVKGFPGMLLGGLLGWSSDLESGQEIPPEAKPMKYAGGGLLKRGAKILKEVAPNRSKISDIIREHGGQWLDKGTLSVTDISGGRPIPNLEGTNLDKDMAYMSVSYDKNSPNKEELEAGNQGVNKKLRKYVKTQMATPDDPIRKLADQGILHVPHENLNFNPEMYGKYPLKGQRFLAKSPEARTWVGERYSDYLDDLMAKEVGELDFNDPRFSELSDLAHNMAVKDYMENFVTPDNPLVINQIKGKGNARPNEKYIPYVQDLIRNHGPWAEILDFENSGLRRASSAFNDLERKKLKEAGYDFGDYLTQDEVQKLQDTWDPLRGGPKPKIPGLKDGGPVADIIKSFGGRYA